MRVAFAFVCLVTACTPARPTLSLTTTAERSGYERTGRYDEAVQLCRDFARVHAEARCTSIGTTGEGRPIVALEIVRRRGAPVILVQAGIHAGEIEGKDAGFLFARDLIEGKVAPGALDHVSLVFVPVINPDGHERFGTNHRPNQRGPKEMGFRTNGARMNLNRDYTNAQTPEIAALLGVVRAHDPVMLVDLHATDGAKFEHDISVITAPLAPRPDDLEEAATALNAVVQRRLTELGHLPLDFYPSFIDDESPHSGFARGEAPARFSNWYMAARNRIGVLVETHSWRTYPERARSTYHVLQAIFEEETRSATRWTEVTRAADAASAKLAGTEVTLAWKTAEGHRTFDFRGYAYERRTSDLTGGTWLVYDETTPETWTVPLYEELVPSVSAVAAGGGYLVDGGVAAQVRSVLDRHGIAYTAITGEPRVEVEAYRATKVTFASPYEGKQRASVEGSWANETRTLGRGALFVPIAQPLARLVLQLFEPAAPDALVAWGHFNTAFERKEYIEPYVIEEAAREMLAADPALRAAFDAAVAADPALAGSVEAKRDWFYRRHPSYDERLDLVPVYRIARKP